MALVRTPHAAMKVWNYNDRLNATGVTDSASAVNELIISTLSLISISTTKTKADPVGTFNVTLAPTRNWISVLTPGSWCVIFMSNQPFTAKSFDEANAHEVKMFGRIDTVRVDVSVGEDGARQTRYVVTGQDWGSVFNNAIYVDPLIQDPSDSSKSMRSALYQLFSENVFNASDTPLINGVPTNLYSLLSVMGGPLKLPETSRLAKATHNVSMPSELSAFFKFKDGMGGTSGSNQFTELITIVWGALKDLDDYDQSDEKKTGLGWIDPFSMVGQHSLWSVLQDNSNYALNEMFPEMFWAKEGEGPQLLLYNRIKPFSYTDKPVSTKIDSSMRSKFQDVAFHKLDKEAVISANAGTNWRDKFNFLEIKPDISELNSVLNKLIKPKAQAYAGQGNSSDVFDREGFRPIMFTIKQLPFSEEGVNKPLPDDIIEKWVQLAQEWYFDCHRLLNGRIIMQGSSEYIPVGDNIMFDASLIGITTNHNSAAVGNGKAMYILGHVESVQNNFSVNGDGSRTFQTTIQYVRGIFVDESRSLIGEGTIDTLAEKLAAPDSLNSRTVVAKATSDQPKNDKKVKGLNE